VIRTVFMALLAAFAFMAALAPARAFAGEDAVVRAATADAVSALTEEIYRMPLGRTLSVGEFVQRTNSRDELIKVLQRAQQIGGARWIDDHTCQVELQISGPVVGAAIRRIAAANPRHAVLPPGEIARAVKEWEDRSFSATGAATSKLPVMKARGNPRIGLQRDPWWNVSQAARDQAVAAAKADAARRSLSSVSPIALTEKSTVGDVLAVKDVGDGMQAWFIAQPAASVELTDDMEAVVELGGSPTETFQEFRGLARKQKEVAVPSDEGAWDKVQDEFEHRMSTPIGRAVVAVGNGEKGAGGAAVTPKHQIVLPARAPRWVAKRIEATAGGEARGSKLQAARVAELNAEKKLRVQIDDLDFGEGMSVGKAAKQDAAIEQAVGRALAHSRIGRAEYHADGSAEVAIYLDLADLWQELQQR